MLFHLHFLLYLAGRLAAVAAKAEQGPLRQRQLRDLFHHIMDHMLAAAALYFIPLFAYLTFTQSRSQRYDLIAT